jgi:hypothetical protein
VLRKADSLEELYENMQEALNLYIEEPVDSKCLAAFPDDSIKTSKNIVEVLLNPNIAFAFLIRYFRIKHGLTQKETLKRMGFNKISFLSGFLFSTEANKIDLS